MSRSRAAAAPTFPPAEGWLSTTWSGGHNSAGGKVFTHDVRVRALPGGGFEAWFFDDDEQAARLKAHSTTQKAGGDVWRKLMSPAFAATLFGQVKR